MASTQKGKGKVVASKKTVKFMMEEAWHRFEALKSAYLIYERGFKMEIRDWSREYVERIRVLHWETFCHPPTEAVLPWVFEFYANAISIEGENVMVRGKYIDISANSINDLFELDNDEHYAKLDATIDSTELVPVICNSLEPTWSRAPMKALKSTSLSREAKVWLLFINASLMPTHHLNNVTYNRLVLIYYILKRINFNVGEVISKHIKMRALGDTPKQLWFLTLITELCRRFGVAQGEGDLITPVVRHITETVVAVSIKVADEFEEAKKKPRVVSFWDASPSFDSRLMKVNIPSGKDATLEDVMDSVEFIKSYQRCQYLYFKSCMDHMQKKQDLLLRNAKIPVENAVFEYQS